MADNVFTTRFITGSPFCIAHLYTEDGEKTIKGSIELVHELAKQLPLCHVVYHTFRSTGKTVHVTINKYERGISLVQLRRRHVTERDSRYHFRSPSDAAKVKQRKMWALVKYHEGSLRLEYDVIKVFRTLPKKYIKELKSL